MKLCPSKGLYNCMFYDKGDSKSRHSLASSAVLVYQALRSHDSVMIVKCLGHAIQMCGRRQDDKDVKYLMRTTPYVERSRRGPLRPADLNEVSRVFSLVTTRLGNSRHRERHQIYTGRLEE